MVDPMMGEQGHERTSEAETTAAIDKTKGGAKDKEDGGIVRFPPELLEKPAQERENYLDNFTMNHTKLKHVVHAVKMHIEQPAGAAILSVVGPTHVGKSTLKRAICQWLLELYMSRLMADTNLLPYCALTAPNPRNGNYRWVDHWDVILRALYEVESLLRFKLPDDDNSARPRRRLYSSAVPRLSDEPRYRRAVIEAMAIRRPPVVLTDEGQHMGKLAKGLHLRDQMDSLKSLAYETDTLQVILATYDWLAAAQSLHGQLIVRNVYVHLQRYLPHERDDFEGVLRGFQCNIPLHEEPSLIDSYDYMYERSLGIIGVLKTWLMRAFKMALNEPEVLAGKKVPALTRTHLEQTQLSAKDLLAILNEVERGERQFEETSEDLLTLKTRIWVPGGVRQVESSSDETPTMTSTISLAPVAMKAASDAGASTPTGKRRPGERAPSRDLIGEEARRHG